MLVDSFVLCNGAIYYSITSHTFDPNLTAVTYIMSCNGHNVDITNNVSLGEWYSESGFSIADVSSGISVVINVTYSNGITRSYTTTAKPACDSMTVSQTQISFNKNINNKEVEVWCNSTKLRTIGASETGLQYVTIDTELEPGDYDIHLSIDSQSCPSCNLNVREPEAVRPSFANGDWDMEEGNTYELNTVLPNEYDTWKDKLY